MFVFSVKTSKRRIGVLALCVAALILIIIAAVGRPAAPTSATASAGPAEGGSETKRVAFLRSLGYEVTPAHTAVREILIPDTFDEETNSYNELQKTAGRDLAPYHGKRLKCWSYEVLNDPSGQQAQAHLYEYQNTIVAGDVSSAEADGFMRALVSVGASQ